jgi:hypothetical protein
VSPVAEWIAEMAGRVERELDVPGYEVEVKPTIGPVIFVRLTGAAEDTTTARTTRAKLHSIINPEVENGFHGVKGFSLAIRSFNRCGDLVLECEVIFPADPV